MNEIETKGVQNRTSFSVKDDGFKKKMHEKGGMKELYIASYLVNFWKIARLLYSVTQMIQK